MNLQVEPASQSHHHAFPQEGYLLIVDDDPMIVDLLVALLAEDEHFPVHATYSAAQALTIAATTAPAALLIDVSLPGADIVETVAHLRLLPRCETIPVLLCSGHSSLDVVAAATGAVAAVCKPFNLDQVVELVERYIQREAR